MNPLGLDMERFVVAEEATTGKVLGFGQLKPWVTLSNEQSARGWLARSLGLAPNWKGELVELASLYVDKENRGQGVGSALVQDLVERGRGKALCLITIGSSVAFYDRLGFEEIPFEAVPRPLQAEVVLGSVVARLAVDDRVLCMAHISAIKAGLIALEGGPSINE